MTKAGRNVPVRAITRGPAHHFFGYYDKFQVDGTGRKMLVLETDFMNRPPRADDAARIGVVHLDQGDHLELVAETTAWCWQQSCMLQWFPGEPNRKIIFNVRLADHFGCCVQDLETGERRIYDRPIYTISSDGRFALCPNFARLAVERPGYGYVGIPDPWQDEPAPEDDGIYYLDLKTGASRLIISLAQIVDIGLPRAARRYKHRFNHLLISPDDRRFVFLHRWREGDDQKVGKTRMFTANVDGTGIYCLNDHDMTSHFTWKDAHTVLAWATRFGTGDHYYLFTDQTDEVVALAPDKLLVDGHMSYSPHGEWLLTDTYPDREQRRHLLLFHEPSETLVDIGGFYSPPALTGEIRCDLHPRWSRDGRLVTFDSAHEGSRQVYLANVSGIVNPET